MYFNVSSVIKFALEKILSISSSVYIAVSPMLVKIKTKFLKLMSRIYNLSKQHRHPLYTLFADVQQTSIQFEKREIFLTSWRSGQTDSQFTWLHVWERKFPEIQRSASRSWKHHMSIVTKIEKCVVNIADSLMCVLWISICAYGHIIILLP